MRHELFAAVAVLCTGCASTAGVFFNRPVVEDSVGQTLHMVSLAADRRSVLVRTAENDTKRGRFCAEPPPDSAAAYAGSLDLRLSHKDKVGRDSGLSADDRFKTDVTVLAPNRTTALDGFRIGLFALCQLQLNVDMDPAGAEKIFLRLMDDFKENLKTEVSIPRQPPSKRGDADNSDSAAEDQGKKPNAPVKPEPTVQPKPVG